MLRKLYATFTALFLAGAAIAQSGGILKGKLIDKTNNEPIPFANVALFSNGQPVISGVTDINGEFVLKPIPAGKYDFKSTYVGYQTLEIKDVTIIDGKTRYMDNPPIGLTATSQQLETVEVVEYVEPLIDPDTKSGGTVTREEFQNMPSKNINSVASTTAGVFQKDEGGALNMRGQRSEGTSYYIDGQKVIGSTGLPQASIEQLSVITGGVPAQYGDAAGGIISITTRGPQTQYFGSVEAIRSLDPYGYSFLGFSAGGPLLQKKDSTGYKKSVLGFIISGEVFTEKDDNPSAIGTWKVKDDVLHRLENSPLRPATIGSGTYRNAEFLTKDSLENIKYKQNVRNNVVRLNGKIDYKPTKNMNFTIGGSVDYYNRHSYIYEYSLLNPVNNPQDIGTTWRVYGKITQRFGSDEVKGEKNTSNIKNAYYTLQVGYTHTDRTIQDDDHTNNYFNYGYVGRFVTYRRPTYGFNDNGLMGPGYYQNGFQDTLVTFNRSELNPFGANYTSQYYSLVSANPRTLNDIQQGGGLRNGDRPTNVYALFYNTGRQYGGYDHYDNSQFRVSTNFSADIKNHAVMVGFEYEQRTERRWFVSPIGLWTLMRQLANFHLSQLDVSNPIYQYTLNGYNYYNYDRRVDAASQTWFDKQLRAKLGAGPKQFIDVDAYDPSMYDINMFSADDLLNGGSSYITYYGYDAHGSKSKSNPSFDDFFTKKDDNGNFTRDIAPYQPVYIAGFVQDKFDFRDIKFNVGFRVDRFDANQKVLKDKYLLYEAKTLGEVPGSLNVSNGNKHPSNLPSSSVVYVNDFNSPTNIVGYRDGDNWYNATGVSVQDPIVIANASNTGTITPYLINPSQKTVSSSAFKDYTPQVTFMPRIAFAFPISDVASFFAHYDVLTQRPTSFYRLDPTAYYFIQNRQGQIIDNPALKPERTTDYELGFRQTLTEKKNSAIQLSAFYRELRDMIQIVQLYQAYPLNYLTYGNIDFGTVKGFSVSYDLRRSGGVQMTASYTLQFADGTGSSASGGYNLVSSNLPNLRSTIPLDFDQRHTFVANFDYRFGSGKNYNGPVWTRHKGKDNEKGLQILKNIGFNLVVRAGSGLPYTKQSNITQAAAFGIAQRSTLKGSINGASLPWQYRVDLRIDKNFELAFGKSGDKKKLTNLNVYLQVLNLLDTKNIINVYHATGNPSDDGYLVSPGAQASINGQVNPASFRDLYSIKVNNPSYYSLPRRIRLGVIFSF